jgi:predicted alpha/beta-fold hydrolase
VTPARPYRPPWWYRGRHLQTAWGPLLRRLRPPLLRRERWETPDGDFLDLDRLDGDGPLLLILHGLEGSSRSHYARGLLREAAARGWRAAVLHFRSCSGPLNRARRFYHAGETGDLDWAVRRLLAVEPAGRLGLVGVSLGGNVLLKWLGERGEAVPERVAAAAAISTPFDLTVSAEHLDRGVNRALYTSRFLSTMKAKVRAKAGALDGLVDVRAASRARTFREYDRLVTAPLNGFRDERDYWARASCGPSLPLVRRPCLLINALNDPFVPASTLPARLAAGSPWLAAAFVAEGGHAGFLEGPWGRRSWAEREALAFLSAYL